MTVNIHENFLGSLPLRWRVDFLPAIFFGQVSLKATSTLLLPIKFLSYFTLIIYKKKDYVGKFFISLD